MLTDPLDKPLHFLYTYVTLRYKAHDRHYKRARTNEYVGKGAPDGSGGVQSQGSLLSHAAEGDVQWSLGYDGSHHGIRCLCYQWQILFRYLLTLDNDSTFLYNHIRCLVRPPGSIR